MILGEARPEKYVIRPEDCYNMDEKGFLIGRIHKAGRELNKD